MKSKALIVSGVIVVALALLGVSSRILAGPPSPKGAGGLSSVQQGATVAGTVRSGFSYQGRLTDRTGIPLDGQYDMVFQFWDAATSGSQVGSDIPATDVNVDNGLFTVVIDVPDEFFHGTALWLRVKVGDEWLDARQEILPVPYALSLWPGADVRGTVSYPDSIFAAINEGTGPAIRGQGEQGYGVTGHSANASGVHGETSAAGYYIHAGVTGYSIYSRTFGVLGGSQDGIAVAGHIANPGNHQPAVDGWTEGSGEGVSGYSANNHGIHGETGAAGYYAYAGVAGHSTYSRTYGVLGKSDYGIAVAGQIGNPENDHSAVSGRTEGTGMGVSGYSANNHGIHGETAAAGYYAYAGVAGHSVYSRTYGVLGESDHGIGVAGRIGNPDNYRSAVDGWTEGSGAGVSGYSENGYGVLGEGETYGVAAKDGMLAPTYDVGNPDVAEYFPAQAPALEPGDVVVLAADALEGFGLRRAAQAYDTAVAGIVSTHPGVTLGVRDGDIVVGDNEGEVPLALVGRVPCKIDASYGAIAVGDLLTTSPTPGHAMRCNDRLACVGAIIGKALEHLEDGTGEILVLVTLQ